MKNSMGTLEEEYENFFWWSIYRHKCVRCTLALYKQILIYVILIPQKFNQIHDYNPTHASTNIGIVTPQVNESSSNYNAHILHRNIPPDIKKTFMIKFTTSFVDKISCSFEFLCVGYFKF